MQSLPDAVVEVSAFFAGVGVEAQEGAEVSFGDGAAEGAFREGRKNSSSAGIFIGRLGGTAAEDLGAAGGLAAAGGGVGSGDDGEPGVWGSSALRNLPVLYADAVDTQIHVGGLFAGRATLATGTGETTHGAQPHFWARRLARKGDDDGMQTGCDGKADLVGRRQRSFPGGAGEIDFEIVLAIEREVVAKSLAA